MLTKQQCQALPTVAGWAWVFNEDGLICFQSGNYKTGFKVCRVLPIEIEDGSYLFMMRKGWTR